MQGVAFEEGYRVIGTGMWLGLIMAANVWFVIWPNQKKALGIKPVDDETKAKAAKTAMMASRINFILSIQILYCMITQLYLPKYSEHTAGATAPAGPGGLPSAGVPILP